jgi:hypothetical protein
MISVIGARTIDGMDPIQMSYKQGYFHYEYGNVNVLWYKT